MELPVVVGVKVSTEVVREDAVSALLRESHNTVALVTGSRGRGELTGLLPGSVPLAVAGRAPCPVIAVRGDKAGLGGTHERIPLGAGAPSSGGEEAVRFFACREAQVRGCAPDAVRAWRRPAHETADRPLRGASPSRRHQRRASAELGAAQHGTATDHSAVRVPRVTVEGPARKVRPARSAAADLPITGARRRHGHAGLRLDRTAHTLPHHAHCPVAVVPRQGRP